MKSIEKIFIAAGLVCIGIGAGIGVAEIIRRPHKEAKTHTIEKRRFSLF